MSKIECILAPIYTPKLIKIVTIKHIMPKNITISTKYYILLRKANRINIDWKIENDGPVIIFHKTHIMISS
jgi:hypothetical protein